MANSRTKSNQAYQDRAGWISKSYKLKKEIADAYKEACDKAGVSQAGQITRMMKKFIEEVNNKQ